MAGNKLKQTTSQQRVSKDKERYTKMTNKEMIEKKVNVTLNLGLVTKNFMPINENTAIKIIALSTDCTITKCTGVYHGHVEQK